MMFSSISIWFHNIITMKFSQVMQWENLSRKQQKTKISKIKQDFKKWSHNVSTVHELRLKAKRLTSVDRDD